MRRRICIPGEVRSVLLLEARRAPSMECCGLLAGRGEVITTVMPATNTLASSTAYEIASQELFALFGRIRAEGLELLGIYHSHPKGDNAPSRLDIERAYYPDAAYFILSPQPDYPRPVRAFRIREGMVTELQIEDFTGANAGE
jgi:proteasome lid subunit RPN8/RPN11